MNLRIISSSTYFFYSLLFITFGVYFYRYDEFFYHIIFVIINCAIFLIPTSNQLSFLALAGNNYKLSPMYYFILLTLLASLMIYTLHGIPLLSEKPESSRIVLMNELSVLYRMWVDAIYLAVIMICLLFFRSRTWVIKCWLVMLYLLLNAVMIGTGFRSRIIDIFFVSVISYVVVNPKNFFKLRSILTIIFTSLLVVVVVVYVTSARSTVSDITLAEILYSIFDRVFLVNAQTNLERIDTYVFHNGELLGSSYIEDFLSFLGLGTSLAVKITDFFSGQQVFVMTLTHYGESKANFGFFMIGFVPILLLVIKLTFEPVYNFVIRAACPRSMRLAFIIYYCYFIPRVLVTGGLTFAIFVKMLSVVLILVCIYFVSFRWARRHDKSVV